MGTPRSCCTHRSRTDRNANRRRCTMKRSIRPASAVLAVLAILSLELSSAAASDAPVEPPTTDRFIAETDTVQPVGAIDPGAAAAMAAERGITVEEATLRL